MPAQSISLDNEYNARLRQMLYDLDHVNIINHQPQMLGGGSPYPQKFALSGNSGQYPPIQMLSEYKAMGGASMGAKVKEKAEQYMNKFKDEASDLAQDTLTKMKPIARRKVKELADKYLGAEEDHEMARSSRIGADQASRTPRRVGAGKRIKKARQWTEFAKEVANDAIALGKKAFGKEEKEGGTHCRKKRGAGFGDFIRNSVNYGLEQGKDVTIGDIAKGYRNMGGAKPKRTNARAVIVKKVMAEKGLGMIEASKYVKAHNLY